MGDPGEVILAAQAFRKAQDELLGKQRQFERNRSEETVREIQRAQARLDQARMALREISRS